MTITPKVLTSLEEVAEKNPAVRTLVEEFWLTVAQIAAAREQGARDMREAALNTYLAYSKQECYTDAEVIDALKSIPLPSDTEQSSA